MLRLVYTILPFLHLFEVTVATLGLLLTATLCCCLWLCACVLSRWTRVRQYWAAHDVPHVAPHPILGNLTFLLKENCAYWFQRIYERFPQSPYIGIWIFWRPAIVVNSYELAQRILSSDSDNFRNRFLGSGKKDPFGSNLFLGRGPKCLSIRKRLSTVFTSAKLRAVQHVVSVKSKELTQRIHNDRHKIKFIDLRTMYIDYATDVITISSFGVNSDATLSGTSTFREITRELSKLSVCKGLSWCCIFFFPELTEFFRINFFTNDSMKYFRKIFGQVVEQRGGYDAKITHVTDIVDALLKIKQDAAVEGEEAIFDDLMMHESHWDCQQFSQLFRVPRKKGQASIQVHMLKDNGSTLRSQILPSFSPQDLSEDELVAIMVYAAFDTTGMILSYATYELAYADPYLQERVYKEIVDAKSELGDEFDFSSLGELKYLNCVLQETLRKYPGMAWLDRVAENDYTIDDKLTVPAGTPVYINCYGMHYDPKYYPNPDQFDPSRFLPENRKHQGSLSFYAFGDGPRHCIGQRFGYQSIRFALAAVIMNFRLHPLPNFPPPSQCRLEKNHLLLQPGLDLTVKFIPRK